MQWTSEKVRHMADGIATIRTVLDGLDIHDHVDKMKILCIMLVEIGREGNVSDANMERMMRAAIEATDKANKFFKEIGNAIQ